jgi:hypothetical protein
MTIQTGMSLPATNYSIPVRATTNALSNAASNQTSTSTIKLSSLGSVQTRISAASLNLARSGAASTTITATGINYSGNVALSVAGLPFGVNYTMIPATVPGSGASSLVITAGASAQPGTYMITVRTAAGGQVGLSSLELVIN